MNTFANLISALAQSLELNLTEAAESPVEITVDDLTITVSREVVADVEDIVLFSVIGTVEPRGELETYRLLLEANVLWSATAFATLGVNSATREVVICFRCKASETDEASFPNLVTSFAEIAGIWRHILSEQNAGRPVDTGEMTGDFAIIRA